MSGGFTEYVTIKLKTYESMKKEIEDLKKEMQKEKDKKSRYYNISYRLLAKPFIESIYDSLNTKIDQKDKIEKIFENIPDNKIEFIMSEDFVKCQTHLIYNFTVNGLNHFKE